MRCTVCQTAWIPSIDFDLSKYYEEEYAASIQPFRLEGFYEFYSEQNPFWETPTAKRMQSRATKHLELLGSPAKGNLLDIGADVGITLSRSPNTQNYAQEYDLSSRNILQNELAVTLSDINTTNE